MSSLKNHTRQISKISNATLSAFLCLLQMCEVHISGNLIFCSYFSLKAFHLGLHVHCVLIRDEIAELSALFISMTRQLWFIALEVWNCSFMVLGKGQASIGILNFCSLTPSMTYFFCIYFSLTLTLSPLIYSLVMYCFFLPLFHLPLFSYSPLSPSQNRTRLTWTRNDLESPHLQGLNAIPTTAWITLPYFY